MPSGLDGDDKDAAAVVEAGQPVRADQTSVQTTESQDTCTQSADEQSTAPEIRIDADSGLDGAGDLPLIPEEDAPPPLPPRPNKLDLLAERSPISASGSLRLPRRASRPQLQARPTTALSLADAHTTTHHDGTLARSGSRTVSRKASAATLGRAASRVGSDMDDSSSVRSYAPSLDYGGHAESLLGDILADQATPAWKALSAQLEVEDPFERLEHVFDEDDLFSARLHHEFDALEELRADGSNEGWCLFSVASIRHLTMLAQKCSGMTGRPN